jgi:Fe-S-cluster-containing dehydrogenase component
MPREITDHQDLLAAIRKVPSLSKLLARDQTGYHYEVEADVAIYGRNYHGKQVGPYFRLLEFSGSDDPPKNLVTREGDWEDNKFYVLVEGTVKEGDSIVDRPGSTFGDMSMLAGIAQLATAAVPKGEKALLLEIQRPAIRLLRKLPGFSESLDISYEMHGKNQVLSKLDQDPDLATRLSEISVYRVYSKGHLLFREGEDMDRLYIIKNGWLRRSLGQDYDFLGAGTVLGAAGIEKDLKWPYLATVAGRTEALEISIKRLRETHTVDQLPEWLSQSRIAAFPRRAEGAGLTDAKAYLRSTQERLIDTGVVDGTNVLVMDMDLCVRCGNCSLACHKVHGQTRLVRRGIQVVRLKNAKRTRSARSLLFPQVCLHCKDAECLTGCPTGAIGRLRGGQVDVNPDTCIGCGDCAIQCPYDAISLIARPNSHAQTRHSVWNRIRPYVWPVREPVPPLPEPKDQLLAVKCNLCQGTPLNPTDSKRAPAYSCELNCPTGALARVDPAAYFKETEQIKGALFLDRNHVLSRNVHKRGPVQIAIHSAGLVLLAIAIWFIAGKIAAYGLSKPAIGRLNMEWFTGILGGAGIAGAMAYSIRRRIYRRRAGALKYWLLAHCYTGALALVAIFFHVGTRTGGLLTTALTFSFDLALVTGLIGIICYQVVPRLMTRIEGTPLLLEDLIERRRELRRKLTDLRGGSAEPLHQRTHDLIVRRFGSRRFLMKQYFVKGVVDKMIDEETEKAARALGFSATADRKRKRTVEAAVTLRRVEALIYLHYVLKAWVVPHALSASVMAALMLLHIIQVIWY